MEHFPIRLAERSTIQEWVLRPQRWPHNGIMIEGGLIFSGQWLFATRILTDAASPITYMHLWSPHCTGFRMWCHMWHGTSSVPAKRLTLSAPSILERKDTSLHPRDPKIFALTQQQQWSLLDRKYSPSNVEHCLEQPFSITIRVVSIQTPPMHHMSHSRLRSINCPTHPIGRPIYSALGRPICPHSMPSRISQ